MLNADRYRGAVAAGYDAHRREKPEWKIEQATVSALVDDGPILDVPLGTGRYLDIYRQKGLVAVGVDISPEMIAEARRKDRSVHAIIGTVLNLPFSNDAFATAVCSRLLNWFYPEMMARAIAELKRVAKSIIVSIRTGVEGDVGNYTHDIGKFYRAIDGLYIAERRLILSGPTGRFDMFALRPPTIADVLGQFGMQKDGINAGVRIMRTWTDRWRVRPVDWRRAAIRAEYWSEARLAQLITAELLTDEEPRRDDGTLTVIRTGGHEALIDGRRRANRWMKCSGNYPVLVVDCSCST